MANDRPYFTPEDVEEQVAWLRRQPPGQADADERHLVKDLQRLYQRQIADEGSLEAVLARLESRGAVARGRRQNRPDEVGQRVTPSGRTGSSSPRPRRSLAARFVMVATAVLLLVVVAGLVAGLVLVSHPSSVTGRPTAPVGATPTFPPGPPAAYAISNDNTVVALDPMTGSLLWQRSFPGVTSAVLYGVQDQTMYVVTTKKDAQGISEETLSALSVKDGTQRWVMTSFYANRFTIIKGLFITDVDPTIQAREAQTGAERWTLQLGGDTQISGLVADESSDTVYAEGSDKQGYVTYAINTKTGEQRWLLRSPNYMPVGAAIDQVVYFSTDTPSGPIFTAYNASDGKERWHIQGDSNDNGWSEPTILNGVIYLSEQGEAGSGVPTGQAVLYALQESDGKVLWHTPAQNGVFFSVATLSQNTADVSDGKGVYAFNAQNGQQRWYTKSGGANVAESPTLDNGLIFMTWSGASTTPGNTTEFVSVLDATTGGERWHYLAADIPPNPDEPPGGPTDNPPLVRDGIVLLSIPTNGSTYPPVQALRASDGTPLWRKDSLTTLIVCTGGVASSCSGRLA